jgi:hypothetical protein
VSAPLRLSTQSVDKQKIPENDDDILQRKPDGVLDSRIEGSMKDKTQLSQQILVEAAPA